MDRARLLAAQRGVCFYSMNSMSVKRKADQGDVEGKTAAKEENLNMRLNSTASGLI